jgi:arylsulfatase
MSMSVQHIVPRFVLVAIALAICPSAFAADAAPRPDILLIMPDQMRGDCLSILGHPVLRTPHFDELAWQGALFRRGYSTCPSCIPARFALLTGLHPQSSGVVGYKGKPITYPTLPALLGAARYATVLVGRTMHQTPPEEPYGYQTWLKGSTYIGDDDYDRELKVAAPRSGGILEIIKSLGITTNGWQAKPWPLDDDLHPTAWIVRQSRKIIAGAAADKPLFLTASFFAPHSPLFPPKKYFDYYLSKKLPLAAHGDWVDWNAVPPSDKRKDSDRVLLEGDALRAAEAGYFGLIEHLDDQIGPLVEQFKSRSERSGRPWLIVLIADHGEMLGDHGYYRKCEPYEGSANIPFIIAGSPELNFQAGLRSMRPVCLEDVTATMLGLAGADRPKPLDGIDLTPVLHGEASRIRDWLHLEHAPIYSSSQAFHALTDGRFKYIWRPENGGQQLFDLESDPHELHDLSGDVAHRDVLEHWRGLLIERLANRPEGFSDGRRLIPGRPYPPLQAAAAR